MREETKLKTTQRHMALTSPPCVLPVSVPQYPRHSHLQVRIWKRGDLQESDRAGIRTQQWLVSSLALSLLHPTDLSSASPIQTNKAEACNKETSILLLQLWEPTGLMFYPWVRLIPPPPTISGFMQCKVTHSSIWYRGRSFSYDSSLAAVTIVGFILAHHSGNKSSFKKKALNEACKSNAAESKSAFLSQLHCSEMFYMPQLLTVLPLRYDISKGRQSNIWRENTSKNGHIWEVNPLHIQIPGSCPG